MATLNLNQQQARKWARRAQLGFFLVAAAALAVAIPGMRPAPAPAVDIIDVKQPAPGSGKAAPRTYGAGVDSASVAARLMAIGNRPIPPEEPVAEEPNPTEVEPAVQDEIRYLGSLMEPTRRLALIRMGDKQHIVSEGEAVTSPADPSAKLTIISVSDEELVVRDGSGERRLKKAPRDGASVTHVNGPAASPPVPQPTNPPISTGSPSWLKNGGRPPKQNPDSPEGK